MTINEIIEEIYTSKDFDDCIRKTVIPEHQADFKQELVLKIYDIPHPKLSELYYRNELKYYIVRIIINLVKNKNKSYHKTYLEKGVVYDSEKVDKYNKHEEEEDLEERWQHELRELQLLCEIDRLDETMKTPFYKLLVYLIDKEGSMRAVSRLTGIPVSSISEAVKRVRNHLNNI